MITKSSSFVGKFVKDSDDFIEILSAQFFQTPASIKLTCSSSIVREKLYGADDFSIREE